MSKMGRPLKTGEPKTISLHLRITQSEADLIQLCSEKLGLNRTETIIQSIQNLAKEINLND